MPMSEMFKKLGASATVFTLLIAGCSSSATKPQQGNQLATADEVEREYLAFRASHSGHAVKPDELKKNTPEITTPPVTVAVAQVQAPKSMPQAKPVAPKPEPVQVPMVNKPVEPPKQQAPVPEPQMAQKPTPAPAPAVKPMPKPVTVAVAQPQAPAVTVVPTATPKPVQTPVPQPVKTVQPAMTTAAVVVPEQTPPTKTQRQMVSNSSLSASDGFLSNRHQITSTEKKIKPIRRVASKPVTATAVLPSMSQLIQDGKVYDARIVLNQVNDAGLAKVAEAIRIIIKEKPRNGTSDLYDVVRHAKAAAPRAMAIDALFQAYPQNATYSAQKLLSQTRYNRIDRLVVGNRIMQYRINRTYPAAITNLGYDASGKALFDARRGILSADKQVLQPLKNYAARASNKPASFIARRLYHWIRNDDTIEQAYADTFSQIPYEFGVIMFRERFGEEAIPYLQKAQANDDIDKDFQPIIQRELAKLTDKSSTPELMFGFHKLYLITYKTTDGEFSLLADQAICPDQTSDQLYRQSDETSSFIQKVISIKADELSQIKKLPNTWKSGIEIHGTTVDTVDLK